MYVTADEIIEFWYSDSIRKGWFSSTPALDREILDSYGPTLEQATAGELDDWLSTPPGCLALVIILDQFPLNMYRGQARSFATEAQAIKVARHALTLGFEQQLDRDKLAFLFMPFMHSEDLADQELSVKLMREYKLDANVRFAEHHRELIRRFGRFPHRNHILGRENTSVETEYLASDQAFRG